MRKYSKEELKHLKWKFIKFEGLSPTQADNRLKELFEFEKNLDKRKKAESVEGKKTIKQKLNEDIKRLRNL